MTRCWVPLSTPWIERVDVRPATPLGRERARMRVSKLSSDKVKAGVARLVAKSKYMFVAAAWAGFNGPRRPWPRPRMRQDVAASPDKLKVVCTRVLSVEAPHYEAIRTLQHRRRQRALVVVHVRLATIVEHVDADMDIFRLQDRYFLHYAWDATGWTIVRANTAVENCKGD